MERKKVLLWLSLGLLVVLSIGMGLFLATKPEILNRNTNGEDIFWEETLLEETSEVLVLARSWDSKKLLFGYESKDGVGKFKINFGKSMVVLKVPDETGKSLIDHPLLSMNSPYWETAFCIGDKVVLELSESYFISGRKLNELTSEDVFLITNLGPSKCRAEF